ncbi:hypothetical protein [Streptomyces sp. NPDC127084]|uniref:hypothetical protein n=1 Tax=Streptomyces sp. NPDC127084 TaxID=3347133 RepID=UPI003667F79E
MGGGTQSGGSSRSDEEWDRFLRESVEGVADAPKEESARARESAARLRSAPERPEGWRVHTPVERGGSKGWYMVAMLAALVLLALAFAPASITGLFGSDGSDSSPLADETARPDRAPEADTAGRPSLEEPFRGSPAAQWANGVAGITVPRAEAVGWMGAAEVEKALARSRDFLVASSLDRGVLRGERPDKAVALINPHQEDVQALLRTAFTAPGKESDPLLLFSRFEPSRTKLVGDEIKTRGRLTYQEGERGALRVTADVTFVYPVTRVGADGDDEVVRTIVRRELVLSWDDPAKVVTEPGTFSIVSYKYHVTNGGCGAPTGYLAPPFGTQAADATAGTEIDPYDRSKPVDGPGPATDGACEKATRS